MIISTLLIAGAIIPSAFAQGANKAPHANATTTSNNNINSTAIINKLTHAQGNFSDIFGRQPETSQQQQQPSSFIVTFVCPSDMETLSDCQAYVGVPKQ